MEKELSFASKRRLLEWKRKVAEQQHFEEQVSSYLRHVFAKPEEHHSQKFISGN